MLYSPKVGHCANHDCSVLCVAGAGDTRKKTEVSGLPREPAQDNHTVEPQQHNSSTDAGTTTRRRLGLTLICLSSFTAYTSVFPVFGTQIRDFFSLTNEQFGSLMGMQSLGRIASLLVVGPLISWCGVRRIAELGILGCGASFLLLGMGGGIDLFQYGLTSLGLFIGVGSVAHPAFLFALFPGFKRRIFSVRLVSVAAPAILLPLVADIMLRWCRAGGDERFHWVLYVPFLLVGGALVGGGLLMSLKQFAVEESTNSEQTGIKQLQERSGIRLSELLNRRSLLVIVLISLHASADTTVYTFLPMFMDDHFPHLPIQPAYAVAGHGLAYVLTRSLLSLVPERYAQRAILCLSGPIGGVIVILSIWSGNALYVPVLYTLSCFFVAAEFPALVSEMSSRSMGNLGTVLAAAYLVTELAKMGMLRFTGRLADQTGDYRVALTFAAGGFIAFGVIAFFTRFGNPTVEEDCPPHG